MAALKVRIAASADDAQESSAGVVTLTDTNVSNDLDATTEWAIFRFQLNVPQGAKINASELYVVPWSTTQDAPLVTLYAEAADTSAQPTTAASSLSSRSRTAASVAWSSTNLGAPGLDSQYFPSPDISSLVQEVVNRAGWVSGNYVSIIVQGGADAARDFSPTLFDYSSAIDAPILFVDYTVGGGTAVSKVVPSSANDADEAAGTVTLTGTSVGDGLNATTKWAIFRFTSVAIPVGATIVSADLLVTPSSSALDTPALTIFCENADNSAEPVAAANNISNRARTTASVAWSANLAYDGVTIPEWFGSPEIKTCVQEVVNRAGWASGNALSVILQGGTTTAFQILAQDYTSPSAGACAPRLIVNYTTTAVVTKDVTSTAAISTTNTANVTSTAAIASSTQVSTSAAISCTVVANVTTGGAIGAVGIQSVTTDASVSTDPAVVTESIVRKAKFGGGWLK